MNPLAVKRAAELLAIGRLEYEAGQTFDHGVSFALAVLRMNAEQHRAASTAASDHAAIILEAAACMVEDTAGMVKNAYAK